MHRLAILPPSTDSPATARMLVRAELVDFDEGTVAVAELMISELVTNAVIHAATEVEIELEHNDASVTASVTDSGAGHPVARNPGSEDEHGRGLRIVGSMADAWGVVEHDIGKSVWFTLGCQ